MFAAHLRRLEGVLVRSTTEVPQVIDCDLYRSQFKRFMSFPLPCEVWDSADYEEWQTHGIKCLACREWNLVKQVQERGIDLSDYPCVHVAYHSTYICEQHTDAWECPDMTLVRTSGGFGIPIRDGGSSVIRIEFCPWCGVSLLGIPTTIQETSPPPTDNES